MRILNNLKTNWKSKSTAQKIDFVIDIITMIGGGLMGRGIGNLCGQNQKPVAKFCIKLTASGLGIAMGETAGKKLSENYAEPIGKIIDTVKAKMKEETAHEQQCA